MKLYSTNGKAATVSLQEAVFRGLPEDNGLYMPEVIPTLPAHFLKNLSRLSLQEISFEVAKAFLVDEVLENDIRTITDEAINFELPLIELDQNTSVLELFHGPTLAFKDFGARFMSRLMSHFRKRTTKDLTILVATSGDTGSAVANGFYKVPGIRVIILYPSGKVSESQEKQLTTLGENITALEVNGNFDDCQAMVKSAFLDNDVRNHLELTSANSINISRLIPQSFYYFAAAAMAGPNRDLTFVTPSGNFGNICAGMMGMKMGLPVKKFVAATNSNDVVPKYLGSGIYEPLSSVATISNAMDVGNPSNFPRLKELFGGSFEKITNNVKGYSFDDKSTRQEIQHAFQDYKYISCPHTAVGLLGWKSFRDEFPLNERDLGIVLSTAHPSKFAEDVESCISSKVEIPQRLQDVLVKEKVSIKISNQYQELKSFLIS